MYKNIKITFKVFFSTLVHKLEMKIEGIRQKNDALGECLKAQTQVIYIAWSKRSSLVIGTIFAILAFLCVLDIYATAIVAWWVKFTS